MNFFLHYPQHYPQTYTHLYSDTKNNKTNQKDIMINHKSCFMDKHKFKDKLFYTIIDSKIGNLGIAATPFGLGKIDFFPTQDYEQRLCKFFDVKILERDDTNEILKNTEKQLKLYFDGKLKKFDIPLDLRGSDFQKKNWNFVLTIPYGEVVSYSFVAKSIGKPNASRAVGNAVHANPIPIVIPCHRVVGKDGSLTGYSSGLKIKKILLNLECKPI